MNGDNAHQQVLRIKNMVCPRCIMAVQDELENLGLHVLHVALGTATVESMQDAELAAVEAALVSKGFELIQDKQQDLAESVKVAVIDLIYSEKIAALATNISTYLAEGLGKDYATISSAFKASEGLTLSRYVVLQKIERAKELISYGQFTKTEIAARLGYKSVQHLSSQFKEVIGLTPNQLEQSNTVKRNSIDSVSQPEE